MTAERAGTADRLGRWPLAFLIVAVGVLAFHGSRGLYEPDEGRYASASLRMLEDNSWWVPKLHGLIYLDKPPLVYWSIAAGLRTLGVNEWGARLANGLGFIACAGLVGRLSQRVWGGRAGPYAAAVYSMTLLPAVAASTLTPDGLLCLFVVLAYSAYLELQGTQPRSHRLGLSLVLGVAIGLGVLTKGPAMMLFVAPMGIHFWITNRLRDIWRRTDLLLAAGVAASLGGSWYLYLGIRVPGALDYAFASQVAGRLWQDGYDRNSQWWRGLELYLPMLTVGLLPASLSWLPPLAAWMRRPSADLARVVESLGRGDATSLLWLWVTVPLPVLLLASSKLPLYVLPLAPPLVIATAKRWSRPPPTLPLTLAIAFLAWLGLKAVAPTLHVPTDTRAVSRSLAAAGISPDTRILMVEQKQHGLPFYGYRNVRWLVWDNDYPYFQPPSRLEEALPTEVERCRRDHEPLVFVSRTDLDEILKSWSLDCLPIHTPNVVPQLRSCRCDSAAAARAELEPTGPG